MNNTKPISLAEVQARPLPPGFDTITGPLEHTLLNDLMFRIVFEANQEALKALLCSLLHLNEADIVHLEIKTPIQLGKKVSDKTCIFDINVMLNNQKQIHLELQVLKQTYWTNRSLCYLCRGFGKLNAGETYNKVKPFIQIDILDFDLYDGTEEFFSTYHLKNDKTGRIYSDKITLHVLQLNKEEYATEEDKSNHIDYWARLFKSTTWEELRMLADEQKALRSTIETMYRVSADDYLLAELEAREDQLLQQLTFEEEIEELNATVAKQQSAIAEKDAALANYADKELQRIRKKIEAGKSLEQIAEELEDDVEKLRPVYDKLIMDITKLS